MAYQPIALHHHPLVNVLTPMFFQPLILETPRRVRNRRRVDLHDSLFLAISHNHLMPFGEIHRFQRPQTPILVNEMYLALHDLIATLRSPPRFPLPCAPQHLRFHRKLRHPPKGNSSGNGTHAPRRPSVHS